MSSANRLISGILQLATAAMLVLCLFTTQASAQRRCDRCDRRFVQQSPTDHCCPGCQAWQTMTGEPLDMSGLPSNLMTSPDAAATLPSGEAGMSPSESPFSSMPSTAGQVADSSMLSSSFGGAQSPLATPSVFGDFLFPMQAQLVDGLGNATDISIAGGTSRFKISEANNPVPTDRVFFLYNHFHDALSGNGFNNQTPRGGSSGSNLDLYTFGLEKTFFDQLTSVELRVPLFSTPFDTAAPGIGDLALAFKGALLRTDSMVLSTGLAIKFPTARSVYDYQTGVQLQNDAVYLQPFVGLLLAPNDLFFYQSFVQLDVATNGNQVVFDGASLGRFNDQTLLSFANSGGVWLTRDPNSFISGMAALVELHYTTTTNNSDFVPVSEIGGLVTNSFNRMDFLNLIAGLHTIINNATQVRVFAGAPLNGRDNRAFAAEVGAQVIRYY